MPSVRKSVIVAHPASAMFELVDRCEHYPEFLPWCAGAEVLERDERITRGRLHIDYHGLKSRIGTLNRKEPPWSMTLEFVEGPFERFAGLWTFRPLGEEGCRVELAVDYTFASGTLEAVMGPVFNHIVGTLVERFVERADAVAR